MKHLRRILILSHRYLGIVLAALVVMWFVTGIGMIYVGGMPRLSPQQRLERLPPLDLARVRLTPAEAVEQALWAGTPGRMTLSTVLDRPAYRLSGGGTTILFADSGELLDTISAAQARGVAARFAAVPESRVTFLRTIDEPDQWTLLTRQLPLDKFAVDDGAGTEVYVSRDTAEAVMITTRRQRTLAWLSTIPHWFYFTALRAHQAAWYRAVVWSSGLTCVLALIGLGLAVTQRTVRYPGLTRWHYVTGAIFGVFTLTWAFSGMLSMEPFAWTTATGLEVSRDVFTGGELQLAAYGRIDPEAWQRLAGDGRTVKEIDLVRIQDRSYYLARVTDDVGWAEGWPLQPAAGGAAIERRERLHQPYGVGGRRDAERLYVAADTLEARTAPFSQASIVDRLKTAMPDVPIVDAALLPEYDSYYYSRGRQTPLPVVRVRFADPAQTWLYVDPESSEIVAEIPRLARVERWLYNGLHSLDFAFWYERRPLWDIGMILLCLGGLATGGLGLWLGLRRLRRRTAGVLQNLAIDDLRTAHQSTHR